MKIKGFLFILCSFFSLSAMANVSKWSVSEERGIRVYSVDSKNNFTLRFSCDVSFNNTNTESVGDRMLELSQNFPGGKSFDSAEEITLKVGDDKYPISSIGSSVGDSWWYGFWKDTPDATSETVDAYVEGKKIATFTMRKAAELYREAPLDGCIKR